MTVLAEFNLFSDHDDTQFLKLALKAFDYQYHRVNVYRSYVDFLGINPKKVIHLSEIPFLPIELFKTKMVMDEPLPNPMSMLGVEAIFTSSGTTGSIPSKHYIRSTKLYEQSFFKTFEYFYGNIKDYIILALLPSYLEREGSSLLYMVQKLMEKGANAESGFFLNNLQELHDNLSFLKEKLEKESSGNKKKILLIGIPYALLDFKEQFPDFHFPELVVLETGGMKGKRKEIIREELHSLLKKNLTKNPIHSEYGMTELLTQAYSLGEGIFKTPPWMKIMIRDPSDPKNYVSNGRVGGVSVIDLANIHSCCFIATNDFGKKSETMPENEFEILGRFDTSDVRGCNLLI